MNRTLDDDLTITCPKCSTSVDYDPINFEHMEHGLECEGSQGYQRNQAWLQDDELGEISVDREGRIYVPVYDNFDAIRGSRCVGRVPAGQHYGWALRRNIWERQAAALLAAAVEAGRNDPF